MITTANKKPHVGMVTLTTVLVVVSVSLVTIVLKVVVVQYRVKLDDSALTIDSKLKMGQDHALLGIIARPVARHQHCPNTNVPMVIIVQKVQVYQFRVHLGCTLLVLAEIESA